MLFDAFIFSVVEILAELDVAVHDDRLLVLAVKRKPAPFSVVRQISIFVVDEPLPQIKTIRQRIDRQFDFSMA